MGADPADSSGSEYDNVFPAVLCLFTAHALLVTSVDMIYAHQDLLNDLKAEIGSMSVTFRGQPKIVLSCCAATQVLLLIYVGLYMNFSYAYHLTVMAGYGGIQAWMILQSTPRDTSRGD